MRTFEILKNLIIINRYKIAILIASIAIASLIGISPLDGDGGAIPISDDPLPI